MPVQLPSLSDFRPLGSVSFVMVIFLSGNNMTSELKIDLDSEKKECEGPIEVCEMAIVRRSPIIMTENQDLFGLGSGHEIDLPVTRLACKVVFCL